MEYVNLFLETYGLTVLVFCLSAVCVGLLVELLKQSAFAKLEKKYESEGKDAAKLKTIKGLVSFAAAFILVAFFMACIQKSELPKIGNSAIIPIWFTVMYLLQLFVDIKGLKTLVGKVLGNIVPQPKPVKKKVKKVVSYVDVDENGNPIEG